MTAFFIFHFTFYLFFDIIMKISYNANNIENFGNGNSECERLAKLSLMFRTAIPEIPIL
jgi:hypothetical protein